MSTLHSPALHQAIDAFRAPGQYLRLRDHELPEDILLLLRIAAGDSQAIESASTITKETASAVSEAAVMFIQHLMFYPGSSSFRVLGVEPSASDAQIKEHYRWLVRWLHPDRNADEWDAVYAERVTLAWQDLRTPDRRRAYEAARSQEAPADAWAPQPVTAVAPTRRMRPTEQAPDDFVLSARTVRRLPAMILAVVTVCAATVLGLQYYPVQDVPTAVAEAQEANVAPPVDVPAISANNSDVDYVVAAGSPARQAKPEPVPVSEPIPEPVAPSRAAALQPPSIPVAQAAPAPVERPSVPAAREARVATAPVGQLAQASRAKTTVPAVDQPLPQMPKPASRKLTAQRQLRAAESRQAAAPQQALVALDAPAPSTESPVARMDEAAAREVIMRFRSAYASGNLNQVRSLLARNTAELDKEQAATLKTYRKLFESSVSRHMEISNPSWLTDHDTAILVASFEAWIQPVGKSEQRRVQGDIRFDLRSEDGEMRIIRVRHVAKGG